MNWKLAAFLVVIILALVLWFKFKPENTVPPDTRPQVPIEVKKPENRNEQSLPPEVKPANVKGRLRVTVKEPVTGQETTVDVLVPEDDAPPTVLIDTTKFHFPVSVEYTPFRDPWVTLTPDIFLGGSVSQSGVSPFAGVSFVSLTRFNVRAGLGADRFSAGAFAAWNFYKDTFNLHVQWNVLKWTEKPNGIFSFGISLML